MYKHVVSTTLIYSPTKKKTYNSQLQFFQLRNSAKQNAEKECLRSTVWDTDFQPILAHQFRNWFMMFLDLNACTMNEILLGSNFVASQVIDDMNNPKINW